MNQFLACLDVADQRIEVGILQLFSGQCPEVLPTISNRWRLAQIERDERPAIGLRHLFQQRNRWFFLSAFQLRKPLQSRFACQANCARGVFPGQPRCLSCPCQNFWPDRHRESNLLYSTFANHGRRRFRVQRRKGEYDIVPYVVCCSVRRLMLYPPELRARILRGSYLAGKIDRSIEARNVLPFSVIRKQTLMDSPLCASSSTKPPITSSSATLRSTWSTEPPPASTSVKGASSNRGPNRCLSAAVAAS